MERVCTRRRHRALVTADHQKLAIRQEGPENCAGGYLTLYATRHLMADWLDNSTVAKRTRDRILGHVTDVPGGYGRKGSINADQMAAISALEPEIVKQMREILS